MLLTCPTNLLALSGSGQKEGGTHTKKREERERGGGPKRREKIRVVCGRPVAVAVARPANNMNGTLIPLSLSLSGYVRRPPP